VAIIFSPIEHYSGVENNPPRVFGAPQRYVQGPGVLTQVGHYLTMYGFRQAGILLSSRSQAAEGAILLRGLETAAITPTIVTFGGECSLLEVQTHADTLGAQANPVDALVAVGGGKCVDTGKALAHRLGVPLIVIPTLASNDAPCSAVSVLYTPAGVYEDVEFYPYSPLLVAVDTQVIANAAERYLVAGMGDAMATWYEARVTAANPRGITPIGGRPTITAAALGQLCADILYRQGIQAAEAALDSTVNEALDQVVEANTLLSGLGFESGGIAAAHAVAAGYTAIESVEEKFLHGEMVAMGLLTQLALEEDWEEARRAATFFAEVGLPIHLGQLDLSTDSTLDLQAMVSAAMESPFLPNMPMTVTPQLTHTAVLKAHALGLEVSAETGDKAYRRLLTG
jgi:glycerol dehydrogenase